MDFKAKNKQWFLDDEARSRSGVNLKYGSFEEFRKERMIDNADIESIYEVRLKAQERYYEHELSLQEKQIDAVYELFRRPQHQLKALENVWRQEHPRTDGAFVIPDRTQFHIWIRESFFRMRAQLFRCPSVEQFCEEAVKYRKSKKDMAEEELAFQAGAAYVLEKIK